MGKTLNAWPSRIYIVDVLYAAVSINGFSLSSTCALHVSRDHPPLFVIILFPRCNRTVPSDDWRAVDIAATIAKLLYIYVCIRSRDCRPYIHGPLINSLGLDGSAFECICRCTTQISHVMSVSRGPLPIISHGSTAVLFQSLDCRVHCLSRRRRRYHHCMRMEYVQYSHTLIHTKALHAIHLNNSTKHLLDGDSC